MTQQGPKDSRHPSISEEHGLEALPKEALRIYSVGVSTAGAAEIRMVQADPRRHVIATTIDDAGVAATRKFIRESGFDKQIEVRNEDVSQPLPYPDDEFDYVYARLVLHYLTRQQLQAALAEMRRTLKTGGRLFVVVRSTDNLDATTNAISYDEKTGMTTHITKPNEDVSEKRQRFFHTKESISEFVRDAGFKVEQTSQYDEKLFHDFDRTIPVDHEDNLIELIATAA